MFLTQLSIHVQYLNIGSAVGMEMKACFAWIGKYFVVRSLMFVVPVITQFPFETPVFNFTKGSEPLKS